MKLRASLWLALLIAAAAQAAGTDEKPDPPAVEFFEKKVRPVLAANCFHCHSTQVKKVKGGLLLDSRPGVLRGGDNGPAVVLGQPDKSRLIEAVRYENV